MNSRIGALSALAAVLLLGCPKSDPLPAPHPPTILSFTADRARIASGESVTLSFETRDAESVVLVDPLGEEIAFTGGAAAGQATVTPETTSLFVLKALSAGGRATAFIHVAVGEELAAVSLVAVPSEIDAGEEVDLIWTAFNAASASLKTSSGEDLGIDGSAGSGMVSYIPTRTERFTLTASGVDAAGTAITATTTVKVRPVARAFEAMPHAALPGESTTLSWSTLGASEIVISERTFGELLRTSEPARVASGQLSWKIPESLPGGAPTREGTPLEFTLTVTQTDPAITLTRTARGYVGRGPELHFDVPSAVTVGHGLKVAWSTRNAVKVQLLVDGLTVFESRPGDQALVVEGEYTIPGIDRDAVVELLAHDYTGGSKTASREVQVVNAPEIKTFHVPLEVSSPTAGLELEWTTTDASEVVIRAAHGPVLFVTRNPMQVAEGRTTIKLGRRTALVLEAWNDAGQRDEERRTVGVAAPAQVVLSPSPALVGEEMTVDWTADGSAVAVFGVPDEAPMPEKNAGRFIDLEAHPRTRAVWFSDTDNSVARLNTGTPFRFPFVGTIQETFFVSTNGFLSFGRTDAFMENQDLESGDLKLPAIIAPFWDDLVLGSGQVLHAVHGDSFPRTLIVQWSNVSTHNEDSKLTFQLQLEETGVIRFVYARLEGFESGGESASIGVRHSPGVFSSTWSHNPGAQRLEAGDSLTWFAPTALSGSYTFRADRSGNHGFFTQSPTGEYLFYSAPVEAFEPGTVVVNEVMPVASNQSPSGRWLELANLTGREINVEGLEIWSSGASEATVLPELIIPAHGYLVVGESRNAADNDGAPVQYPYTDLPLEQTDTVMLTVRDFPVSEFSWKNAQTGTSVIPPETAIDTAGAVMSCPRTKTFGSMSVGSPGQANERCFEYDVVPISGAFLKILTAETQIATVGFGTIPLEVPFTYFGKVYDQVHYSTTGGFLTFGERLAFAFDENPATPGASVLRGTVAPFWDLLTRIAPTGGLAKLRMADHTIISWEDWRISGGNNAMSFQVKLFDDGVIEFHYGEMTPGTYSNKVGWETGTSATTWIERPDGSAALPLNINTEGGIQPHSGYRFVPRQ